MSSYDTKELQIALGSLSKQDYAEAFRLFKKVAETGNPKAQLNLATCHDFGFGVKADAKKAIDLYLPVAEQSITEEHISAIAYTNMAAIYICGREGVEPDRKRATECHRRARELGFPMSIDI